MSARLVVRVQTCSCTRKGAVRGDREFNRKEERTHSRHTGEKSSFGQWSR